MSNQLDYYLVPALSNSGMSALNPLQGGSPRRFKNVDREERKYSLSLDRGSLLHLAILEPHKFITQDADKPSGMMGAFIEDFYGRMTVWNQYNLGIAPAGRHLEQMVEDACSAAGYKTKPETVWKNFQEPGPQAYYQYLQKAGNDKLSITRDTREIIDNSLVNLQAHPLTKRLFFEEDDQWSTWNELEIYWNEEVEIALPDGSTVIVLVPCKAKVDRLRYSELSQRFQNVDLKTTGSGIGQFGKSYEQFRYYRQNAFYDLAIRRWAVNNNIEFTGITHLNAVVETTGLNEVGVFKTTEGWLEKGREEYQSILKRYAWHLHFNKWQYPMEYYLNGGLLPLPSI